MRSLLKHPTEKILIVLPFLSLITEKETKLRSVLTPLGFKVASIHSHKSNSIFNTLGNMISEDVNVVLCTIEKSNGIINRLLEQREINLLRCLVIDELHLIGDETRGFLLEILLSKIMYLNTYQNSNIQIISMSATFPNIEEISSWLNSSLYVTEF